MARASNHETSDILALSACALQFGQIAEAEKALNSVPADQRETAPFEAGWARLAETKNNVAESERRWRRACELDPTNKSYELGLALAELKSDSLVTRDSGRARLETLRGDEKFRAAATRAIIADAILHNENHEAAKSAAKELQKYPETTFSDRLLELELLRVMKDDDFATHLTDVENEAKSDPAWLAMLLTWMNNSGMALVALDYTKGIDKGILSKWPVPAELAKCYARVADWPGLERLTREVNWPQADYLRRAYLARALRSEDKKEAADREWAIAENEARTDARLLEILERTAVEWGWTPEAIRLLWQLAETPEKQSDALHSLYKHYAEKQDTQGLYRVLSRLVDVEPSDDVHNNFAQIALLLNVDIARAKKIASDLHREDPNNAVYASTCAFSFYKQGDVKQAVQIMKSLPAEMLQQASAGIYYGIFLAAAGRKEEAAPYLARGDTAELLPEEKALLDRAKHSIE